MSGKSSTFATVFEYFILLSTEMITRHYAPKATIPLLLWFCALSCFAQNRGYTLHVSVSDKVSREAIVMATVQLQPSVAATVTDADGRATIGNVPAGDYTLQLSYVGYEPVSMQLKVTKDLQLAFQMQPTSLALKEVTVVARQRESGASTSSVIGRQAIDHLQATSLADVMQLLPGQLMDRPSLTARQGLQLRTLGNNSTQAFGTSIVVDGIPMSNNAELAPGTFSKTAATGTDLRQIAADDIDEVEVIRGIPSAEYGDLTSGLVVVHSKVGVTPWQVKAKVNPALQNYSAGKGFSLGSGGIVNASADYAQAWGDPRKKDQSFDRYTLNLGYGKDLGRRLNTNTKLRLVHSKEWNGNDPDALQDGTENKATLTTLAITHNGRLQAGLPLLRTLKYTAGLSLSWQDSRNTTIVPNSTGLLPLHTARQTGYYSLPWLTTSYQATGITESRPGNVFAKVTDDFFLRRGKTVQTFKVGMDYRCDWNSGRGYYNADEQHPYRSNSNGRPRPFDDIPALHQLSLFAEDQFTYHINKVNRLRVNFGLRFTALQPFEAEATTALSPRLNVAFSATKWLDVRAGVGMNSKTPGLNHLYPDKKYNDEVVGNFTLDATAPAYYSYTNVYNVERSAGLKNATTTKMEAGIDIKLPHGRKLSLMAYQDRTPNGFEVASDFATYTYNYFDDDHKPAIVGGLPDFSTGYAGQRTVFITTGRVGNTDKSVNRGLEFDLNLGELRPLHTTFYLSGAWNESRNDWSTDRTVMKVPTKFLSGTPYVGTGLTPFYIVYNASDDYTRYRRFVSTLRVVTHVPQLNMVASLNAQVVWHDSHRSIAADRDPAGWITPDLQYHAITSGQTTISYDGVNVTLSDPSVLIRPDETEQIENPTTWYVAARLTKELGKVGGLSLYVDNALFYEPFMTNNITSSLRQRNTGKFGFGVELYLNL